MKKSIVLLYVIIIIPFLGYSQLVKKNLFISVFGNMPNESKKMLIQFPDTTRKKSYGNLNLSINYALNNSFSIGINTHFTQPNKSTFSRIGIGPSLRYYLPIKNIDNGRDVITLVSSLKPKGLTTFFYAETSVMFGTLTYESVSILNQEYFFYVGGTLRVPTRIIVLNRLGVDVSLGMRTFTNTIHSFSVEPVFRFGVNFYLDKQFTKLSDYMKSMFGAMTN